MSVITPQTPARALIGQSASGLGVDKGDDCIGIWGEILRQLAQRRDECGPPAGCA
jgi:hypothetical protein